MKKCPYLDDCAYYQGKVSGMAKSAIFIKEHFCLNFPEKCARRMNAKGKAINMAANMMTPLGFELLSSDSISDEETS